MPNFDLLDCRNTECHTMSTYIVSTDTQEYWVCGRHVLWAMKWLATANNGWTVKVRYNAYHKVVN